MRILYLTFEFPPGFGGGLSTYMAQVCAAHSARGDEVHVLALDAPHRAGRKEFLPGVQVHRFAAGTRREYDWFGHWPAVSVDFADRAARIIRDHGPFDAVEVPDGFGIGYMLLQRRLTGDPAFADTPVITLAHTPTYLIDRLNDQPTHRLPVYWQGVMEKFSLLAADAVVSPSRALVDRIEADLGKPLGAQVIRNPMAVPAGPIQADAPPKGGFFMASRLAYWKGAERLPALFRDAWAQGLDAPLTLYGGDTDFAAAGRSMRAHLEDRYAREIAAGRLRLPGPVPRVRIDVETADAIAQVHPSLFDNFPYSALESMAAGRVTILHDQGGHLEIVENGVSAITADLSDAQAGVAALRRAAEMPPEARAAMGRAAREAVRAACDPAAVLAQKAELVEELQARNAPRRLFPFIAGPARDVRPLRERGAEGRLSVVIPFYNMGKYIDETLVSVLCADWPEIEVVLVDDGSTDPASLDALARIEREAENWPPGRTLQLLRGPNRGVAAARNRGAEAASGALMALLDADDVVQPDYYRRAVAVLEGYDNLAFVGCWNEDFRDESGETIRVWSTWNPEPPSQLIFNMTNCQGLVYWRAAFLEAGRHDPSLRMFLDDWESVISLMAAGLRGAMLPAPLFRYRIRDASIFRSKRGLWEVNYEKIAAKHADYFNRFGAEIAAFLNANGPNENYHIPGHASGHRPGDVPAAAEPPWVRQAREHRIMGVMAFMSNFFVKNPLGRFLSRNRAVHRIAQRFL
ncbi:glycosyltransferase [Rhodovulum sp. DZ06]|uniref:glycosyltransferase n=1 Tax=Rhodovulum sp. DZ06 TaxID=3425126 RepID=UPI003D32DB5C